MKRWPRIRMRKGASVSDVSHAGVRVAMSLCRKELHHPAVAMLHTHALLSNNVGYGHQANQTQQLSGWRQDCLRGRAPGLMSPSTCGVLAPD